MESRGLHLQRADGLPAGRRPRPGPQAGQAAGRDDHRRVRARVRLEHARDPPRRDPARPEGPDRRRPARDRRHGQGTIELSSGSRARSSAWRSSSSSTSSRAATGSRAAASRASSSTDADRVRRRGAHWPVARRRHDRPTRDRAARAEPPRPGPSPRSSASSPASVATAVGAVLGAAQALQQHVGRGRRASPRPGRRRPPGPTAPGARPRAGALRATSTPPPPASGRRSAGTATCASSTSAGCPTSLVELEVRGGRRRRHGDPRRWCVRGAPAIGQVAAIGARARRRGRSRRRRAVRPPGDAPRRGERAPSARPTAATLAGRSTG